MFIGTDNKTKSCIKQLVVRSSTQTAARPEPILVQLHSVPLTSPIIDHLPLRARGPVTLNGKPPAVLLFRSPSSHFFETWIEKSTEDVRPQLVLVRRLRLKPGNIRSACHRTWVRIALESGGPCDPRMRGPNFVNEPP